jgi:transcriptional antiterminator NusG
MSEVDVDKEVPEVDVDKEVPEVDVDKSWYVIHTYSGFEQKVKISLEEQFERSSSREALGEIIIPVEDVVEVRKGKKKVSSRKFFPGYILISVDMSRDIWYMIKNTAKVTGFLGSGGKPVPLSEDEVKTIKGQISGETSQPKPKFSFEKGESVRVVEGPFINFNGTVDEVNQSKGKVRVMVSIFGRATPVELEFPQIEAV